VLRLRYTHQRTGWNPPPSLQPSLLTHLDGVRQRASGRAANAASVIHQLDMLLRKRMSATMAIITAGAAAASNKQRAAWAQVSGW
jgi:hypothetical protein